MPAFPRGENHGIRSIYKLVAGMKCKGIQFFLVQILMLLLLQLMCCITASMASTYPALSRASIYADKLARRTGPIAPSPSPFTVSKSTPHLDKITEVIRSERSELPIQEEISSSGSFLEMDRIRRHLIGSSMPHCGHTCGACAPCHIRIVGFECDFETGTHAEACPLGYSCTCNGRSFPVP